MVIHPHTLGIVVWTWPKQPEGAHVHARECQRGFEIPVSRVPVPNLKGVINCQICS